MAREFRGDPLEWARRPWGYVLWCLYQLQEDDRRTHWRERMERVNAADLAAIAFHEPHRIAEERQSAIAAAAAPLSEVVDEARARWLAMTADLARAKLIEVH